MIIALRMIMSTRGPGGRSPPRSNGPRVGELPELSVTRQLFGAAGAS